MVRQQSSTEQRRFQEVGETSIILACLYIVMLWFWLPLHLMPTLHQYRCRCVSQCPAWVSSLLGGNCQLAFINTDAVQPSAAVEDVPAPGRHGVVNPGEAALLMQLLGGLLACGVPGSDITMVSPYKAQVGACCSSG
jgi:hypothetical protein